MRFAVVIVAGGRGTRLSASQPKQLLDLEGRSILQRSVDAFAAHPEVTEIVVVLPAELVADGARLADARVACRYVAGGARRQDSVRHGVAAVSAGAQIVLIHDAARPLVDAALIDRVRAAAERVGAAVPAVAARDTVKRVDPDRAIVRETVPRREVWLAQTPQGFRRDVLDRIMLLSSAADEATDEAMLAERAGCEVAVVDGDIANLKITTADDLAAARAALVPDPRVGTGYDLHRLVPGRPLVLAGLVIPSDLGPQAHSDGDVVCHALIDALLGAAAAGDIGRSFPDNDPAWKDAAGLDLLTRAVGLLRERGLRPASVDVTVVLERPKLATHVPAIREALAGVLRLDVGRVSVKAKTNEGMDAVGRGEAIAAQAVALVSGITR